MLVAEVMLPLSKFPVLPERSILKVCLEAMGAARLGIVAITDDSGRLTGVFTDGDLRRNLLKNQKPLAALFIDDVQDHMVRDPHTVNCNDTLSSAIQLMEKHKVWDLPVIDNNKLLVGLLHLHPAVQALLN